MSAESSVFAIPPTQFSAGGRAGALGTVTTGISFCVIGIAIGSIAIIQRRRTRRAFGVGTLAENQALRVDAGD